MSQRRLALTRTIRAHADVLNSKRFEMMVQDETNTLLDCLAADLGDYALESLSLKKISYGVYLLLIVGVSLEEEEDPTPIFTAGDEPGPTWGGILAHLDRSTIFTHAPCG